MKYSDLVSIYEKLEETPSKLEKANILADFIKSSAEDDLKNVLALVSGDIFHRASDEEMRVSTKIVMKSLSNVTGYSPDEIEDRFRDTGDLGKVIEDYTSKRKQKSLAQSSDLSVSKVISNLKDLATYAGASSQKKRIDSISELLNAAKPSESKYIVRTILGELRIGVADGIMKAAIVKAFLDEEEGAKHAVDYAWNILLDFGRVASIAKEGGVNALKSVKIELGIPHNPMLGEAADSFEGILEKYDCAIEPKIDGMRAEIHKDGKKVTVFTRSLENVTMQFPDVVEYAEKSLKPKRCVVEAEIAAIDKSGNPLPFQTLSQRIQRKHNIDQMVKKIPIKVNLFDITFIDGEMLFSSTFKERREILESSVNNLDGKFSVIDQIVTKDIKKADKYYQKILARGDEGVMVKNRDSLYVFGRKVGGWYKIKPILEPLDLVVIGATWGEGKRSNWLSSFALGVRDEETGNLMECGRMATGLSEEQYDEITKRIRPLIEKETGRIVTVKPEIVVEVGYQEIQKSPTYSSGYALRFPRLLRFRDDKDVKDADSTQRMRKIYTQQSKKKAK